MLNIQNLASKKAPGFFHIFSWDIWDPRQTALREHRWATFAGWSYRALGSVDRGNDWDMLAPRL